MIDVFSLTPAALTGEMSARGWVPAIVTLLTYQFFHADIMHVLGNMIFLWVFGDDIERALGRERYLALPKSAAVDQSDSPDDFVSKLVSYMAKARG